MSRYRRENRLWTDRSEENKLDQIQTLMSARINFNLWLKGVEIRSGRKDEDNLLLVKLGERLSFRTF